MKIAVFVVGVFLLFVLTSRPVLAHLQQGPAYLLVNGGYADTAPVVSSKLLVPQDLAKKIVVAGAKLNLKVDLTKIIMPPTQLASAKWRLAWEIGGTWEDGSDLTHVYKDPGSKLLTLQESDQLSRGFQNYDLIQVNVVPKSPYDLPSATVTAQVDKDGQGNFSVKYLANAAADKSTKVAKIEWDFGDSVLAEGTTVTHFYKPFQAMFITVRVTDSNGIFNDTSWKLDGDGNLTSNGANYNGANPAGNNSNAAWIFVVFAGAVFLGAALMIWKIR